MKRKIAEKKVGNFILSIALLVFVVGIWIGAGWAGILKPYTLPSIPTIWDTAVSYIQKGKLQENIIVSFAWVYKGFLIAMVIALAMGTAVALFPKFEKFVNLILQIVRPIPPIAWIPLAILWFGIGEGSKLFIIFLGSFFAMFTNTVDGIKGIDIKYFELGSVYEISKKDLILHIVFPGAMPQIMTGICLGLGQAWVCVVAAEMIGATKGVGYMLIDGRSMSRPDVVILGMLIIGVIGKLMDDLLRVLRKKLISWT